MRLISLSGRFFHGVARDLAFASMLAAGGAHGVCAEAATSGAMQWPFWGGSVLNKSYAPNETKLSPATVPNLKKKWVFTTHGSVSATPTVDGDYVYATDAKGYVYKINRNDGSKVWEVSVPSIIGTTSGKTSSVYSRNSPAITSTALIFGDQASETVMAIDKNSGAKLWTKSLKTTGSGHITSSPVVYNNVVYAGVSSFEDGSVLFEGKKGPSFRGSVWALNATTGEEIWHQNTVPDGYTGGGVWGSTLVVDAARGSIYATTGNNYSLPTSVTACVNAIGQNQDESDPETLSKQDACLASDDYVDSVIAYDMSSGNVKWAQRMQGADVWTVFCLFNSSKKCPFKGVDWDFGSGANLIDATINGQHKQLLGAGNKSGIYRALDPDTGATVWTAMAGPPGTEGGIQWGSATDDTHVYVAETNFDNTAFTLIDGSSWNHGVWAALDAATGKILWQTKPPSHRGVQGQSTPGAVSVANGVVYAGTLGGYFVALDASNGKTLWNYQSGGSVIDSPSIVDGVLYWGSGYQRQAHPNNQLYAFYVP